MKVRVQYTIKVSEQDRMNLTYHFGEWPSRSDIRAYLMHEGTGGLEELHTYARYDYEELREMGVPSAVARRHAAKKADETSMHSP